MIFRIAQKFFTLQSEIACRVAHSSRPLPAKKLPPQMKKLLLWKILCVGLLGMVFGPLGGRALGDPITTTGAATLGPAPSSVLVDATESDSEILIFQEQTVNLAAPLPIDVDGAATGSIPAGTRVRSYFVHFDPIGTSPVPTVFADGSVTFGSGEEVLGLVVGEPIGASTTLFDTDPVFGLTTTTYPLITDTFANLRGFELGGDFALVTGNTVSFSVSANTFDQLRILVQASVPEPASIAIWSLLGLISFAITWHRARRGRKPRPASLELSR